MNTLNGKHILVGVTGGIAAYKVAFVIRELKKRGAEVKVVMTPMAKQFITPLTLATLSQNPILVDFFDPESGAWNSHVSLGLWADAYLIAPATANTIGKMANGIADNLLLTAYLSAKCPVFVAPAMDLDMYQQNAVKRNIRTLEEDKTIIIDAEDGFLASGLSGKGRMAEPQRIIETLEKFFLNEEKYEGELSGKTVMITAGPTYEKIDPVRFIGNYSSGKMGYALAEECARRGARVFLVSGPVSLSPQNQRITKISVESAHEMYDAAMQYAEQSQILILCAAVADYTPEKCEEKKIKREKTGAMTLSLVPTQDIAASLGRVKKEGQTMVGFALETDNEEVNAVDKCLRKNLDFIVMNSLNNPNTCFRHDTNKVTIYDKYGQKTPFELKSKSEVAVDIVDCIIRKIEEKKCNGL